jgi:hypothetical protein
MKFTLKCEHYDYDIYSGKKLDAIHVNVSEFDADGLDDILEKFEMFLRGNGFHFEGNLDVVNDDYPESACTSEYNDEMDYDHPEANFDYHESETLSMCPVCKIDNNIMKNHTCFDKNCPKGK